MSPPVNSEALLAIYDVIAAPGNWRRALDLVAKEADAKAILMVSRGATESDRDLNLMSSEYLDFSRTVRGMLYGVSVGRNQRADWDYLAGRPALEPTPDTEMRAADALDRRPDYAWLRRHVGVGRRVGVRLTADRLRFDGLSLGYDARLAAASPEGLVRLRPLLPHLAKAAELGRTFLALRAQTKAALGAIDRVAVGLAVVTADGAPLVTNAAFDAVMAEGDGIGLGPDGRLRAPEPDARALHAAIAEAAATAADGTAGAAGRSFALPRRGRDSALMLDVAPLRDGAGELAPGLSGALLTLTDPEAPPPLDASRFASAYGLTAAETAILALILEGLTVGEIAARRDVSAATAKNQVAAVLRKTGCARRAELIRLALRAAPPLRPPAPARLRRG